MTIDEAIKILDAWIDNKPIIPASKLHVAARLGIEALKWRMHCEAVNRPEKYPPLPGETEV